MTEPALASYVYCVVAAGEKPSLEGLAGVEPAFGVHVITHGALSAVASDVRLEEFGAEALKRNLENLEWVEHTALAHNAVLGRALDCDAVVPLRLCTIFSDEAHVREMLEREQEYFLATLERLRGHAEWSVKVLAGIETAARERSPALAGSAERTPGRDFFARKRNERLLREEARATAEAAAEETHARLQQEAAAAVLLRPQHPDLSRRSGQMVLNGAYLVERSRAAAFEAVARELAERHRRVGLDVEVSGPWAPYSFVPEREDAT